MIIPRMAKAMIRIIVVMKTTGPRETWIPKAHIIKETELSERYVGDLLAFMKRANYVETQVGRLGGWRMRREVTLLEVCQCCSEIFNYETEQTWSGRANFIIRNLLEKAESTFI